MRLTNLTHSLRSLGAARRLAPALLLGAVTIISGCASAPSAEGGNAEAPPVDAATKKRFELALTSLKADKKGAAREELEKLAADEPDLAGPYVNLGILHYHAGDLAKAKEMFSQAVARNSHQPVAHNYLGILARKEGEFDQALHSYEQAIVADPSYAYAHLNMGILFDIYLQEPAKALEHYRIYQQLTKGRDKDVDGWIVLLERRLQGTVAGGQER